jgi:hypothetical protein
MTTALDLFESAMGKIGVFAAGDTVSAEDSAVCLKRLNSLMTYLESEGVFNYATTRTTATLPANTTSRTIGPAMQFALIRPIKILRGSYSRVGTIDYPLEPVSEQEYNSIYRKTTLGAIAPSVCFYDGGIPTGIVYFWPAPSESAEVHLLTPATADVAVTSATVFNFPPGYQLMMEYNLAVEIAADFNRVPTAMVFSMAKESKRKLKRSNAQIPQMGIDAAIMRGGLGGSPSDFYSGY